MHNKSRTSIISRFTNIHRRFRFYHLIQIPLPIDLLSNRNEIAPTQRLLYFVQCEAIKLFRPISGREKVTEEKNGSEKCTQHCDRKAPLFPLSRSTDTFGILLSSLAAATYLCSHSETNGLSICYAYYLSIQICRECCGTKVGPGVRA